MKPNEANQTLDRKLNCSSNGVQLVRSESESGLERIVTGSTSLYPVFVNRARWNFGRLLLSFQLNGNPEEYASQAQRPLPDWLTT